MADDDRHTIHVKVQQDRFQEDRHTVMVAKVHDPKVVSWQSLVPFRTRAAAETAATTLAMTYRLDGQNVVEGDVPDPSGTTGT